MGVHLGRFNSERAGRWLGLIAVSLLPLLEGCGLEGPMSSRAKDIVLSEAEFGVHWQQLERRWPAWFKSIGHAIPTMPAMGDVHQAVRFLEVSREFLETCTFFRKSREIHIGDDKWQSGCVAHEIGHASLALIGHPCWDDWEHPNFSGSC